MGGPETTMNPFGRNFVMPVQSLVHLNRDGREELMSIEGIDSLIADAIIAYREQNGEFKSVEDLRRVSGIDDSLFDRIKNSVTVSGPAPAAGDTPGCRSTFRL
jgi:competence ComEA-like helix-hairpin-helix protein